MLETPSLPDFKSGMPAFGEQLSHEEIVGVLTYVKSLWGDKTSRGSSIVEWQALGSADDPFPPTHRSHCMTKRAGDIYSGISRA